MARNTQVPADHNAPPITKILAEYVASHASRGWSDAVDHEAHRTFLNWLGCAVGAAKHEAADAALAAVAQEAPDLVLVDFAMPGMNGAEAARMAQERQPGIKVLMVSGYADSAAVEAALGTARLLRKPFDLAELGSAVAETLADVR